MFIFHALASSLASDLSTMVRLSLSARRTAISMFTAGYKVGAIQKRLEEEDVCITTRSLYCWVPYAYFVPYAYGTYRTRTVCTVRV